jgi:tetratricopeptide (TPR) repeat protein
VGPDRFPYPGLRSFRADESDIFFGRDDCIDVMLGRLADTRFLAVLGSSGIGKSSLVKTGLLSALQMGLLRGAGSSWLIVDFRPGQPEGSPLRNLARGLLEVSGQQVTSENISNMQAQFMRDGPRALLNWCHAGHLPTATNLLILVDQFEELFRYQDYSSREEAEAFVALLLESRQPLEAGSPETAELPIYVTITMRSEFLGACSLVQNLPEAITTGAFLTPRMTREQYREAIVGPSEVCGGRIDEILVNRMLNGLAAFAPWDEEGFGEPSYTARSDLAEAQNQVLRLARRADQLPVLQHALNRMWRSASQRNQVEGSENGPAPDIELTAEDYDAVGGLEDALNLHAEAVLGDVSAALGGDPQHTAERMFRALAIGATPSEAVRRPTRLRDLIDIADDDRGVRAFIEGFRADECNFLMPETAVPLTPDTMIDISHESLIRQWKRLSQWVVVEAAAAQQWRQLNDRFNMGEPLRGRALGNFVAWRSETRPNAAWSSRYGGAEFSAVIGYLEASERTEKTANLLRNGGIAAAFATVCAVAVIMYGLWQSARSERDQAENASVDTAQVATLARDEYSHSVQDYEAAVDEALDWAPPALAANLHLEKAQALGEIGNLDAALDEVQLARKADPEYLPTLVTAADLEVGLGRADAAARDSKEYLQVNKTNAVAYGNLILAQAMHRAYDSSLSNIGQALHYARLPIGDVEDVIAPDVQTVVHGFSLSVGDSDFLLALRYLDAGIDGMKGDKQFVDALHAADQSDRDYPYSRNSYLTAITWLWQIVRGQAAYDAQTAQANGGSPKFDELKDYGVYAIEGALWSRMALTRPEYRQQAARAYQKFRAAYHENPQERYRSLAVWVDSRMGERSLISPPEPSVHCLDVGQLPLVDCAQAMAERAQELKSTEGDSAVEFAPAYSELSAAINLLEPKPGGALGRRQKDLLIDLRLRRASWRLGLRTTEADKGGAADDARAVIELDPNVPEAYRILAAAAFDGETRKANDDKALLLEPYNSAALQDLADLVSEKNPAFSIALLQKRQRVEIMWPGDYSKLAELETRVGNYTAALDDIDASIVGAPGDLDYYGQRRDIETKAGNVPAVTIGQHFAWGLHDAAAYEARTGNDSEALRRYVLAFLAASGAKSPRTNAQFELDPIVRDLSAFLSASYGAVNAGLFWQSLSHDPLLDSSQQHLAAQEAARLSQKPSAKQ